MLMLSFFLGFLRFFPVFFCFSVSAGISIPSAQIPAGYDRVFTSSGTSCDSTQDPDMVFQVGVVANQNHNEKKQYGSSHEDGSNDEYGVYAQLVIPISDGRRRVDCSKIYELELRRLEAEIEQLKLESELSSMEGGIDWGD